MARFDVQLDDRTADAVRVAASARGQSITEFTRRAVAGRVGYEAGPYTFRGLEGPSFVRDLASVQGWAVGDDTTADEAFDRLRRFERWSEDVVRFAPITVADAEQVVPPGYRQAVSITPGLDRPLASACETARINSAAPFNVPRASGDDSVDADRVEGEQPTQTDPVFDNEVVVPVGLSGKVELTRELVDSSSPGGDLIALATMVEDWQRQAEARIYSELNSVAGGTITAGFVSSGAQARVSTTPATNLLSDVKKALLSYANARRRKPRNVIAGAAALDHLGGLVTVEDTTGDDTALMRIFGARVNGATNDFATGSTDMRVAILGTDDVVNFESPLAQFRFNEQQGPALVTAAIWGYHAVVVARPLGVASIRFS